MIALIDYGSGNIHSAARALRVAANNAKKTREIRVTSSPAALATADRIVLPGVGHFADCMANLKAAKPKALAGLMARLPKLRRAIISPSRTWAGTSLPSPARAIRFWLILATPRTCILSTLMPLTQRPPPIALPTPTMARRSPPPLAATISSGHSFTPKKARPLACNSFPILFAGTLNPHDRI